MKKTKPTECSLEEIEKLLKPKLVVHICYGLTLIAPYLHLFRVTFEESYHELLKITIATGVTLPLFTLNWVWYVYELRHYKIDAKEIYGEIENFKES